MNRKAILGMFLWFDWRTWGNCRFSALNRKANFYSRRLVLKRSRREFSFSHYSIRTANARRFDLDMTRQKVRFICANVIDRRPFNFLHRPKLHIQTIQGLSWFRLKYFNGSDRREIKKRKENQEILKIFCFSIYFQNPQSLLCNKK